MNSNLRLISNKFYEEIEKLPFFFVRHPGYEGLRSFKPRNFEYRKFSRANISLKKIFSGDYVQGTLWGGKKDKFFSALDWLNKSTELDLNNGIIAKVHDESYLNAYLCNVCDDYKILDSSYTWPEGWATKNRINIMSIDKIHITFNFIIRSY